MMIRSMLMMKRVQMLAMYVLLLSMTMTTISISAFQHVIPLDHRAGIVLTSSTVTTGTGSIKRSTSSSLNMAEKKKSKPTSGGGGFGSNSSITNNNVKKARSISSKHTGAGTKALASAANTFDRIRKLYGKGGTTDVYVRSPKNDESVFWFVGKVVRMLDNTDGVDDGKDVHVEKPGDEEIQQNQPKLLAGSVYPTISEAVLSQKRLILEYAKCELRPQNMGLPAYSPYLELWIAPGDSEMDVARNHVTLAKIDGSSKDVREGFNVNDVGYNPEVRDCLV